MRRRPARARTMTAAATLFLLVAHEAAAARVPAPPERGSAPGWGTITYATAQRAYLDRGSSDGLVPGQPLALLREGALAARCRIEIVAEHGATCLGDDLRAGDEFRVAPRFEEPTWTRPPRAGPGGAKPGAEQVALRRAAVLGPDFPRHEYVRRELPPAARARLEVTASHASWAMVDADGFGRERLDLSVPGIELNRGLRLFARLAAYGWSSSPADARFGPGSSTKLSVRELALSTRDAASGPVDGEGRFLLSAGRLLPWHLPGVVLLDGAQAGWRASRRLEIGAFGGTMPDPSGLAPSGDRWTAGAYYAMSHDEGSRLRLLRHEGRLNLLALPSGTRLEAESSLQAFFGPALSVVGDLRLSTGDGGASADAARFDVRASPAPTVRLAAAMRYQGRSEELAEPPSRYASRHALLSAGWDVAPWLALDLSGGRAEDLADSIVRSWVGSELGFPRLLSAGRPSVGWFEHRGEATGRNVWLQSTLQPWVPVDLLARASFFLEDTAEGRTSRELGLYASAGVSLGRRLSLRVSALGRLEMSAVPRQDFRGAAGFSVTAAVKGSY